MTKKDKAPPMIKHINPRKLNSRQIESIIKEELILVDPNSRFSFELLRLKDSKTLETWLKSPNHYNEKSEGNMPVLRCYKIDPSRTDLKPGEENIPYFDMCLYLAKKPEVDKYFDSLPKEN